MWRAVAMWQGKTKQQEENDTTQQCEGSIHEQHSQPSLVDVELGMTRSGRTKNDDKQLSDSFSDSFSREELAKRVLKALSEADSWVYDRSEFIIYVILGFGAFVNGGFSAFYGWFAPSVQYLSITDSNSASLVIIFGAIYVVLGVHCLVALYYDEELLKDRLRRIECVARVVAHGVFVIPACVLMAVVGKGSLYIRAFEQVYYLQYCLVFCSVSAVVSCRSKFVPTRPILMLPLMALLLCILLGAQCELFGLIPGLGWSVALNAVVHSIGGLCISNAVYQCIRLVRGQVISPTALDTIIFVFIGAVWILSLRVARGNGSFSNSPTDPAIYPLWVIYRYGFGCAFLFMWQLRTTYVTLKRIESEEKREVVIRSRVLQMERMMAVKLLHSMVPPRIADDLSKGREVPPEMFAFATVFFSDIEGFTKYAAIKTPLEVFTMLNRLFRVMDFCVGQFPRQLYKVETIGDAYMVVGGIVSLDEEDEDEDEEKGERQPLQQQKSKEADLAKQLGVVDATCQFALLVREAVQMVPFDEISFVRCRMGIHCGEIVTGVSGSIIPRFSCYGDSVNTASRMESTGISNKIHISGMFADMVRKGANVFLTPYALEQRSAVEVKGKGLMQTYFLEAQDLHKLRGKHRKSLRKVEEILAEAKGERWCLSEEGTLVFDADGADSVASSSVHSLSSSVPSHAAAAAELLNRSMLSNPSSTPPTAFYLNAISGETFRFSFQELADPLFNVLKIECDDFESIVQAILVLIEGIVGTPGCRSVTDPATLDRLVRRVGTHYRLVPYHNWHHAFCVVQQTAAILMRLFDGDLEADEEPPVDGKGLPLAEKDRFVLMLAALVHDVDHPGHNNAFEVRSKSSLALLYNDQNVLENHHLALFFNIGSNASYDVFKGWSQDEAADARKLMISCVLATDMDLHQSLQDELLRRAACSPSFSLRERGDVLALCRCVLHAADVSNPTRPFATSARISLGALQELDEQVKAERGLGLQVSTFMVLPSFKAKCQGEQSFCSSVARPYFAALKNCFPGSVRWNPLAAIDANAACWQQQAAFPELQLPNV